MWCNMTEREIFKEMCKVIAEQGPNDYNAYHVLPKMKAQIDKVLAEISGSGPVEVEKKSVAATLIGQR